jgi:hypothetical protein
LSMDFMSQRSEQHFVLNHYCLCFGGVITKKVFFQVESHRRGRFALRPNMLKRLSNRFRSEVWETEKDVTPGKITSNPTEWTQ